MRFATFKSIEQSSHCHLRCTLSQIYNFQARNHDLNPAASWLVDALTIRTMSYFTEVGLGGIGITLSPRDPRFAGSNPAEVDGFFFPGHKNPDHNPESESTIDLKTVAGQWAAMTTPSIQ